MSATGSFPLETVVSAWRSVAEAAGRNEKVSRLAGCLQATPPALVPVVVAWLSGDTRQGRTGVGPAAIRAASGQPPAESPHLAVAEVDGALEALARVGGAGSGSARAAILGSLFARATRDEQDFLGRLLLGELRQGALAGLMADAIARASSTSPAQVRRAIMMSGDAGTVAQGALERGAAALATFRLQLLRPIQPMLAQTAESVEDALDRIGRAALEHKLDGARIQVHRAGDETRVFTRRLNDVTASVPEVVEAVLRLPCQEIVLDGEALVLRPDGTPLPFQVSMQRFGRTVDVERARAATPLSCFLFDCLHTDGETLIDQPAEERFARLESLVPAAMRVPRIVTADPAEAAAFLRSARDRGHEGLMAKGLDSGYEAGMRGGAWLKFKPAHTLDLVVLAAEWGSGRRRGWLSNLHLGARDERGGFVMLGKTFKGLTDETLEWQTRALLARETARDARTVHVRPELVVEIAFNDIQTSPRYPGGLALRFARVKGYRPDKSPAQADTVETVRAIHERSSRGSGCG
jgi:DNA ligase-1